MKQRRVVTYDVTETGCHIMNPKRGYKRGIPQTDVRENGKRKKTSLHRFIYEQKYGKIPEGKAAVHTCGVRDCINPDHVKPMTQDEMNLIMNPTKPIQYYVDENNCHVITSHSTNGHRPEMNINGVRTIVARHVLSLKLGREIAEGMVAMHLCDNGNCINPNHIIEATQSENINDAERKGRMNHNNTPKKLTTEGVSNMRREYKDMVRKYASEYGVTIEMISCVIRNKAWKHTV